MCAKLTVWALDWDSVIERGKRALDDMIVYGVKTTIPYYKEIMDHPEFKAGEFNTAFVETHPELTNYAVELPPELIAAAISAQLQNTMAYKTLAFKHKLLKSYNDE